MKFKILLILIISLAFILRVFYLDRFPIALYGDEQAFAWNAYNILKLGQDEYGNSYPLQFRSFDDYKAPVPVYLLVPFIKIFGLNPLAIRFPIALAATATVFITYMLSKLFLNRKTSLLIAFLIAISPWHMHLSRGFFEATLALLWFIIGIYFYLRNTTRLRNFLICMFFFALSMYSYFTPRILIPIFILFLFLYEFMDITCLYENNSGDRKYEVLLKKYAISLLFLIIISFPLVYLTLFNKGFSRFDKLSSSMNLVITDTVNRERFASNLPQFWKIIFHNKVTAWTRLISQNYLENLSLNYWYIYGDNSLRYFTGNTGMFYLIELPFLIIGIYYMWIGKRKFAIFLFGWILLAPIPASLVGKPFALRSLAILPAPLFFSGYGIYKSINDSKLLIRKILIIFIIFGFVSSLGLLLIRYYFEYPVYAATWWGWENKAALNYAKTRESKYDKIFISDFYSGGTLAFAVYNKYDPLEYRYSVNNPVVLADGRKMIRFGKYYYGSIDLNDERLRNKIIPDRSLYIGRPEEPEGEDRITSPDDGRLIFVIHDTLKKDCYLNNKPNC